jgi:dimethylhistidine N-methyltransferase
MLPFVSRDITILGDFARDTIEGLSEVTNKKWIKPKYLYDEFGSCLFERICEQPEYYPFRTETGILTKFGHRICEFMDEDVTVIELGSGNSSKTRVLLSSLLEKQKHLFYLPIDVSQEILLKATTALNSEFTGLDAFGIAADYLEGIRKACNISARNATIPERKFVLFLGSTIGNFEYQDVVEFLSSLRASMQVGDILLLGFDLQKDIRLLENAYNDKLGFTAAFNLNLLSRINRELGGGFRQTNFQHLAFYNTEHQRIEMNLISKTAHEVYVKGLGRSFSFSEKERIHTENSYKFTLDEMKVLVQHSGFQIEENFLDNDRLYCVSLMVADA